MQTSYASRMLWKQTSTSPFFIYIRKETTEPPYSYIYRRSKQLTPYSAYHSRSHILHVCKSRCLFPSCVFHLHFTSSLNQLQPWLEIGLACLAHTLNYAPHHALEQQYLAFFAIAHFWLNKAPKMTWGTNIETIMPWKKKKITEKKHFPVVKVPLDNNDKKNMTECAIWSTEKNKTKKEC